MIQQGKPELQWGAQAWHRAICELCHASLATLDMKYKEAIAPLLVFQRVAGLAQKMRNVDDGKQIAAFDDQALAVGQPPEHLAGAQHRQRAIQTAQIEKRRGSS
jgi:hypothetical protein